MRGEADALSMPWSILRIVGAELIRDKKINLLLQTGGEKDADLDKSSQMRNYTGNRGSLQERQMLRSRGSKT